MTLPRLAHGVMTITLDGRDLDLQANPHAARAICRQFGGLTEAFSRVNAHDFPSVVSIVNAAANRTGKAAEATEDAVFAEGLIAMVPVVATYLGFLAAGGKAPKEDGAAEGTAETAEGNAA